MIELLNIDCMEYMKTCEDNAFDLAIVDPPYGIGEDGGKHIEWKSRPNSIGREAKHIKKQWDNATPDKGYFDELCRVSKDQIIWGGNYFTGFLSMSGRWVVWDKEIEIPMFTTCELAWTSFKGSVIRRFKVHPFDKLRGGKDKIHPTQKPVALYRWLLDNYAKPNDRILDTHAGSFSSAVACKEKGFSGVFCELDKDYFKAGKSRVDNARRQYELAEVVKETPENIELFNQHDVGCKAVE